MTRAELQAILAELRTLNPEVRIELRPRLHGGHFQVFLHLNVMQDVYVHPDDNTPDDEVQAQIQDEIAAFIESMSSQTRARLRLERLRSAVPRGLDQDLFYERVVSTSPDILTPALWTSAAPFSAPSPPPVRGPALPAITREPESPAPVARPAPPAEKAEEPATLWERLEEG